MAMVRLVKDDGTEGVKQLKAPLFRCDKSEGNGTEDDGMDSTLFYHNFFSTLQIWGNGVDFLIFLLL